MTAIDVNGLTKRYGATVALNDLSFSVEEGEVFGFLGPNGAGKSTTINILLDFARPTAGEATVFGMDTEEQSREIRQQTGFLPEGFDTYDRLTARKHLEFAIRSKDSDDEPAELLERVGLEDAIDRKAGGYSKGMTQRLMLAMALVGDPELLILDEPSTGLDPNGAREMRELVQAEVDRGATVFFSSHIMEQVEAVCDRVGILKDGQMVTVDTVEGLRDSISDDTTLRITVDHLDDDIVESVRSLSGVTDVRSESGDPPTLVVTCSGSKSAVISAIEDIQRIDVLDFTTERGSLDDVFRTYTTGAPEGKA